MPPSAVKKNIALILPSLSQSVEQSVSVGVEAGFKGQNINLLHMSVGWVEPEFEHHIARLHQSVQFKSLDGIIIYGAAIHHRAQRSAILRIIDCYPNVPVINLGDILDGVPSIIFDNQPVFKEFVRHLVVDKHCQRIAFLAGPENNYDAQQRREAFLEAMSKHGLTLAPELDWLGEYNFASGSFAVKDFVKTQEPLPDAVVCANDFMALGVIDELLKMGVKVPEDIKITGFDDLEYAQTIKVPLTTGRNPIFEMSKLAAQTMALWLEGHSPQMIMPQASSVIYRQSTAEQGERSSHLENVKDYQRKTLSRDSNSERLSLSREINRLDERGDNIQKISSLLYEVGGRQLLFMHFNEKRQQFTQVYQLQAGELTTFDPSAEPFSPLDIAKLLSQPTGEDTQWVIAPVGQEEFYFGFVLVEVVNEEADLPEFIANELSKRLENIALASDAQKLRNHVEKTEKMASLGRLVSGLAHEINTPLGTGLVAASNLADEIQQLKQLIADGKMTKRAFDEFIGLCDESQQMIFSSLKRTAELVSSFKKVSVDQQFEEQQKIDLSAYLTDVVLSLKPRIKRAQIDVVTEFDGPIVMNTHPGTWAQIVTNLLLNAFIHGFDEPRPQARVTLTLKAQANNVNFTVEDNGKGIEKSKQKLIYDPFFTTRRAQGGTGLGLNIVFNMVTQKLNGYIEFESQSVEEYEQHGTRFTVTVPLDK